MRGWLARELLGYLHRISVLATDEANSLDIWEILYFAAGYFENYFVLSQIRYGGRG